ncbi:hypothetical protein FACS1894152_1420 [Bacilli bacterium]|nr:hypothetical protein FACS1894152_1420 [Bacilli bacterium]
MGCELGYDGKYGYEEDGNEAETGDNGDEEVTPPLPAPPPPPPPPLPP